ncbi:hypothetical protein CsatA_007656 [Cannabis sativa]
MMLATPELRRHGFPFVRTPFRSHAINEDEIIRGDNFSLPLVLSCGLSSDLLPKRRRSSIADEPNRGLANCCNRSEKLASGKEHQLQTKNSCRFVGCNNV